MFHILSQMLLLFGVIMIGFASAKTGAWPQALNKPISHFVLTVTAPMLILSSVMGDGLVFEREEIIRILWVAVVNYLVIFPLALLFPWIWTATGRLVKRDGRPPMEEYLKGQLRFMTAFGNVTFIGFPVVSAIFGPRALFYAAVLTIPFNLLMYTIGEVFIAGSPEAEDASARTSSWRSAINRKQLLSPCTLAAAATVVLAFFKFDYPPLMVRFFHLVGDMTIPAALIIIGSTLGNMPKRAMLGSWFAYRVSAIRLILVPAVVWLVLWALGTETYTMQVAVVLSGMPVGVNGVMFCLKYNKDERLMAQTIFLSTALSMLTIPALAFLLGGGLH